MKYYINECLRRKADGELLDKGFYLDTDNQEITWHEPIPGGVAHTYTIDEVSYEDGTPVSVEDGELIGELVDEISLPPATSRSQDTI
jgi:hypothetical protein